MRFEIDHIGGLEDLRDGRMGKYYGEVSSPSIDKLDILAYFLDESTPIISIEETRDDFLVMTAYGDVFTVSKEGRI